MAIWGQYAANIAGCSDSMLLVDMRANIAGCNDSAKYGRYMIENKACHALYFCWWVRARPRPPTRPPAVPWPRSHPSTKIKTKTDQKWLNHYKYQCLDNLLHLGQLGTRYCRIAWSHLASRWAILEVQWWPFGALLRLSWRLIYFEAS